MARTLDDQLSDLEELLDDLRSSRKSLDFLEPEHARWLAQLANAESSAHRDLAYLRERAGKGGEDLTALSDSALDARILAAAKRVSDLRAAKSTRGVRQ